jgi:hypothetical protein
MVLSKVSVSAKDPLSCYKNRAKIGSRKRETQKHGVL